MGAAKAQLYPDYPFLEIKCVDKAKHCKTST